MDSLTTFADRATFERALSLLARNALAATSISPDPGYGAVGVPALVLSPEQRSLFMEHSDDEVTPVGWVDFRPSLQSVPHDEPPIFAEDIVGRVAIVLLAPCVADVERLRLTAHIGGDLAPVLPYLNAELPHASYMSNVPVLSLMDGHRMISLYADRIAIAKADDIVDAWATLERLRVQANTVWARREEIVPSEELRRRPPFIEIYKRLPGTNCRLCGQTTCMAFATSVWRGEASVRRCQPVFAGARGDLKEALLQICSGLGVFDSAGA